MKTEKSKNKLSRRDFLRWTALTGAGLIAARCAPIQVPVVVEPEGEKEVTTAPQATSAVTEIGPQETLIIVDKATASELEPSLYSGEPWTAHIWNVYGALVIYNTIEKDGIPQSNVTAPADEAFNPWFAESYEVADDERTWTFKLRQGVLSPEGNEMTAESFVFAFDRAWELGFTGNFEHNIASTAGCCWEAVDKYTFKVTTSQPNSLFLPVQSLPAHAGPIDVEKLKTIAGPDDKWGREALKTTSAGFGPYYTVDFKAGEEVVYEANPNYFDGVPSIKRVIWRQVPSSADQLALIQSGAADIAMRLSPQERLALADNPDVNILSVIGRNNVTWYFNHNSDKFKDVKVRRGLAMALPLEDIVQGVYGDVPIAMPSYSIITPMVRTYTDEFKHTYDPDGAMALLKEAGAEGLEFELSWDAAEEDNERIATFMRTALEKTGVKVNLAKQPSNIFAEQRGAKTFETMLQFGGPFIPDPYYAYFLR